MLKPTKHWLINSFGLNLKSKHSFKFVPNISSLLQRVQLITFDTRGKYSASSGKHSPSRQSGGLKLAYDPNIFLNHLNLELYGLAFIKDIFSFITSFISKILSHLHLGQHNTESLQTPLPHTPSQ